MMQAVGRAIKYVPNKIGRKASDFVAGASHYYDDRLMEGIANGDIPMNRMGKTINASWNIGESPTRPGDFVRAASRLGTEKAIYAGKLMADHPWITAAAVGVPVVGAGGLMYMNGRSNAYDQAMASQQLNPYNQAGMGMETGLPTTDMTEEELMMLQGMY